MTEALTLGWNQARCEDARKLYQRVLGFNMILHVVIGLMCLFFPYVVADLFKLPTPVPDGWTRGWGATLILVTALYVPGLMDPETKREPNLIGIGGRFWMGTVWVFCGGGFLAFAAFDYLFAVVIGLLYLRFIRRAVMCRP